MDLEKLSIERLREGAQMSELYYQKPLLICYSGGKDEALRIYRKLSTIKGLKIRKIVII